jgi:hypothetical protein
MFEGVYFEFPKLGFLLFVFLGCDQLCPLRSTPLLFPHLHALQIEKTRVPWEEMAKWIMIVCLIVALMSPIKETPLPTQYAGYQTLIIADDTTDKTHLNTLIALRPHDAIALFWGGVSLPLTHDHKALRSIITQLPKGDSTAPIPWEITQFLATQSKPWVVILSNHPQTWKHQLPSTLHDCFLVPPNNRTQWLNQESHHHPAIEIMRDQSIKVYYYFYPLFVGFMALLVYLYGRNQRGRM